VSWGAVWGQDRLSVGFRGAVLGLASPPRCSPGGALPGGAGVLATVKGVALVEAISLSVSLGSGGLLAAAAHRRRSYVDEDVALSDKEAGGRTRAYPPNGADPTRPTSGSHRPRRGCYVTLPRLHGKVGGVDRFDAMVSTWPRGVMK